MINNLDKISALGELSLIINILKMFFIILITYYTFLKITNTKITSNYKVAVISFSNLLISIFINIIGTYLNPFISVIILFLMFSILLSLSTKNRIGYSLLVTIISLCISYIFFFISCIITFFINAFTIVFNNYINLLLMCTIHLGLLYLFFKIKRFKNGFAFLQNKFQNEYFDILMLNIGITVIVLNIISSTLNIISGRTLFISILIFSIITFVTIRKLLTLYYKHKLLNNELIALKTELEEKNIEINKLENENLNFSKISHSIAHKQKSIEHKLNQLISNNDGTVKSDINNIVKSISEEYFNTIPITDLPKTDIIEIDDMLKMLQYECIKNNINFTLQLNSDVNYMVNNIISKDDLEILIADLVKNAIIAVNSSANLNRSILVKLGVLNGCYNLSVYDSGIEFDINTFAKLGKIPCTTHSDIGGSGMGFLNIFDTLKRYKASLIITEKHLPSNNDYTKFISVNFNNINQFKIYSYRSEELKKLVSNNVIIENID